MANLQDIAKRTGVSIASVSRILNGDVTFNAAESTREKVIKMAKELGYKTSKKNVKKLDAKQVRVGILQMYPYQHLLEDPYYFKIENSIEEIAVKNNMKTTKIINHQDGTFSKSEDLPIDGIFAIGIYSNTEIEEIKKISPTIVFIDSAPDDLRYNSVVPNYQLAIEQSIRYFLESGHTQIGFIGEEYTLGDRHNRVLEPRLVFFESIMKPMGLFRPDFVIEAATNVKGGYEATKEFLENNTERPTAFFVSSDSAASGVLRAVIETGLKIPEDISLITFNNTILSESALVPLTSISVHIEKMAEIAVKDMKEVLTGEGFTKRTVIPCELVIRESVKEGKITD